MTHAPIRIYSSYEWGCGLGQTNTKLALAIHILTLLAQAEGDPVTSELMAGSVNTNPAFIRRILGLLSRGGLVLSQPGVGGGWRLRRSPCAISLLDVYRAVGGGRLLATHHRPPNANCPIGKNIERALRASFGEAERAFEQALARQTVSDVLDRALAGTRPAAV